jgi:hypothetical protein
MIAATDLPPDLLDLGLLVGLLEPNGAEIAVNTDWFSHPTSDRQRSLANLGTRFEHLVALLTRHLTADKDQALGARWLHLPDEAGTPTPLCLAHTPPANGSPDQLGIGALVHATLGEVTVDVSAYMPLVGYDSGGATPLIGSDKHPLELGLTMARSDARRSRPTTARRSRA